MDVVLWLRYMFNWLIFSLLICNLAFLTMNYMKYETDTNVAPYWPVKLNATKLSLCFSISSLMDQFPHGYSFSSYRTIEYINLTFDEVFRRMPSASSALDSCKYRDFDLDILREEKDGRKCAELFKVTRYRMQGYICYRFTFPLEQEYSFHLLANSLDNPRELFRLGISRLLSDQHILYPLLHLDEFPENDRVFNGEAYKESGSLFQLSYDLVESYSLPFPYETHCVPVSKLTCYQNCLASAQRALGYSPDSDLTMENSSASSLRLMPAEMTIDLGRSSCYDKCSREACTQLLFTTRFNSVDSHNEILILIVETLNRFSMKILYLPKFPLIDYITQVGSVISIWIGVSVISLSKLIHSPQSVTLKTFHLALKVHYSAVKLILSSRQTPRVRRDALSLEKKRLLTRTKRVSVVANLFKLSLLPVLSWQLFNVVYNYFLFQTTAKFNYDLNPQVIIPTLGFCLDYDDLVRVRSTDLNEESYHSLFLAYDSMFNRTVKQLLQQAPSDIIEGCFIRDWKSRFKWLHFNNASGCSEHFSVKKFYADKKLCYQIFPKEQLTSAYYQSDVKFLLTNPGVVYSIIFHSKVHFSKKLNVFAPFGNEIPRMSVEFPVRVYRSDLEKNMISLSNRLYRIKYLPAPYDTSCNPVRSREQCLEDCMSQVLSKYDRISYVNTEERPLDMPFLSYSDLLNDSINDMWRKTEMFCLKKCHKHFCNISFTTTFIDGQFPVADMKNVFAVNLPSHPSVEMRTVPVMSLYYFLYELLCCFSFWLGVSFVDLSPTPALMKRRMEIKVYLTQMYLVVDKVVDRLLRRGLCSSFSQKMQGVSKRKLLNLFLRYLAMSLCFCHLVHSMMAYMTYSLFIDVYEQTEKRTNSSLLICLDTAELIARKLSIKDPLVARSVIFNRTVASLFADTPKENELIQECGHWGLYSRRANLSGMGHVSDRIFFSTKNKTLCDEVYEIRKAVVQSYTCFLIWPRNHSQWTRDQMKLTLNQHKTLIKVSVNSSLLTQRFSFLVSLENHLPFTSSNFAHNIIRDPKYDHYDVSYIRYIEFLRSSPKTTDGFVPFLFDRCLNNCINEKLEVFNLTLSRRFTEPSNARFLSQFDRRQVSFNKFLSRLQNKCEVACVEYNTMAEEEDESYMDIFVPTVEARQKNDRKRSNLTTITLKITNHPVLSVNFKLKLSPFLQIINFGSILSLWFGFSAVTLARIGRIEDKEIGLQELLAQKQRIWVLRAKYNIR